jgi:hypothetical protein
MRDSPGFAGATNTAEKPEPARHAVHDEDIQTGRPGDRLASLIVPTPLQWTTQYQ